MNRKDEHLKLALKYHDEFQHNSFDDLDFIHSIFSRTDKKDIDLSTQIADFNLSHPFYINAMTGGTDFTKEYNRKLAILARETNTMMALGSLSPILKDKSTEESFSIVRKENPNGIILANLGADKTLEDAKKAIELIQADGIQIHINMIQEIIMPEGEREFSKWPSNIENIIENIDVPVIIKEVGFGMDRKSIKDLIAIGAKTIDIAGKGGTNFAKIENTRRDRNSYKFLENYGNSTVVSLLEAQKYIDEVDIIASGGIRNSLDIVKSLSLGAKAVSMAGRFIKLIESTEIEQAIEIINEWKDEIKSIMTFLGASDISELYSKNILLKGKNREWCDIRDIDYKKFANREY